MVKTRQRRRYTMTFLRQWREHRGLTQEVLAERVGVTHATISRLERGLQPYGQDLFERLAKVLQTDAASLLAREPNDPEGIWSVWDQAKPGERRQIVEIAKTLIKTAR
jgi:transcriptional regulator with XRE-family HTH domain